MVARELSKGEIFIHFHDNSQKEKKTAFPGDWLRIPRAANQNRNRTELIQQGGCLEASIVGIWKPL